MYLVYYKKKNIDKCDICAYVLLCIIATKLWVTTSCRKYIETKQTKMEGKKTCSSTTGSKLYMFYSVNITLLILCTSTRVARFIDEYK